jgi:hypothetical protein
VEIDDELGAATEGLGEDLHERRGEMEGTYS